MWALFWKFYKLTRTYKSKLICLNEITLRADRYSFIHIIIAQKFLRNLFWKYLQ